MSHVMVRLERVSGAAPSVPYWQAQRLAVQQHFAAMAGVDEQGQPRPESRLETDGGAVSVVSVGQAIVWYAPEGDVRDVTVELRMSEGSWSPQLLREMAALPFFAASELEVEGGVYAVTPVAVTAGPVTVRLG